MLTFWEKFMGNKKFVFGILIGGLIGGFIFYMTNYEDKNTLRLNNETINSQGLSFNIDPATMNRINQLKQVVVSELQLGNLSRRTVESIQDLISSLMKEDYFKILRKDRVNRRKYLDDINKYAEYLFKASKAPQELMEQSTVMVFKKLNLDF